MLRVCLVDPTSQKRLWLHASKWKHDQGLIFLGPSTSKAVLVLLMGYTDCDDELSWYQTAASWFLLSTPRAATRVIMLLREKDLTAEPPQILGPQPRARDHNLRSTRLIYVVCALVLATPCAMTQPLKAVDIPRRSRLYS